MMVGIAGSGKTTCSNDRFAGHARVSLDINHKSLSRGERAGLIGRYERERPLGLERQAPGMPPNPAGPAYAKVLSRDQGSGNRRAEYVQMADLLKAGKNVVIDDTNLTPEIRWPYILLARRHGAAVKAVYFKDVGRAYRQNARRKKKGGEDPVPERVLDGQLERLEPPTGEEGFDSVIITS